ASSTTTTRQKAPNQGLGNLPSPWNPMARIDPGSFGPNFSPANRGGATLAPLSPPDHDGFRKTKFSMASAAASVTTARFTPLTRSAGMAAINPNTMAASAPTNGPMGN